MLKKVAAGLAVVLVAFLGFVATRPGTFTMERTATIPAPVDVVYAQVSDFNHFTAWSPWMKADPNAKITVTGDGQTVGQKYHWAGNDDIGEGEMTLTAVEPNKGIKEDLHFIKPFESKARVWINTTAEGEGTKVAWGFESDQNFGSKLMSVFVDMDKMLGKDFEDGLANLSKVSVDKAKQKAAEEAKKKAEADAAAAALAANPPAPVGDAPPAPVKSE